MNEIDTFHELFRSLLNLLELPVGWDHEAEDNEAELLELQLALGFPNLSAEERSNIATAHFACRAVTLGRNTRVETLSDEEKQHLFEAREESSATYLETRKALEQSGLRVKLSGFQERLLSSLVEANFPQ